MPWEVAWQVRYMASRATQDIDVVMDLHADQIKDLYQALAPQFYLDEGACPGRLFASIAAWKALRP